MSKQTLQPNATLQGGKFKILSVLGQGGFGITYLAEHNLLGTKVAIKEFFMKDFCNREDTTSHVSVVTEGGREQVSRFREKFLKEARNIARLHHPNIVRISDVFEENGTAYYVMDYCEGGSLADLVKHYPTGMGEARTLKYIRQVASALQYIHEQNMNHLDVKPANILLDSYDNAILIDFGLSKQYDSSGGQTSTTPVGISHGYAPIEQYKQGGVKDFSPTTDIYSLGATLYKLITGKTPPDAQILVEDTLPSFTATEGVRNAIKMSMNVRRQDRPQSIKEFINLIDSPADSDTTIENTTSNIDEDDECTLIADINVDEDHNNYLEDRVKSEAGDVLEGGETKKETEVIHKQKSNHFWFFVLFAALVIFIIILKNCNGSSNEGNGPVPNIAADSIIKDYKETIEATTVIVRFSSSPEDAEVHVDGRYLGTTPFSTSLKYGKHKVTISKDGYQNDTKTIDLREFSDKKDYFVTLNPQIKEENLTPTPKSNVSPEATKYSVSIISNAPNTRIWIDGSYVRYDLPTKTKLEKGRHSLSAESQGYKRKEMTFYVEKQNQIINIELVKANNSANSASSSNSQINVRGTIKDSNGKPISGTVVNAKSSGKTGVSDRYGNFEIQGATKGETLTVITAEKTYYQTASSNVAFVINNQTTSKSPSIFIVRGTIKDSNGKPISGTVVKAKSSGKTGVSDRYGNFEIQGATKGETLTVITAEKTYYQTAASNVAFVIQQSDNQGITVNGIVVDKKGEPMVGTMIVVKGSANGTVADIDGNFTLHNVPSGALLEFSFVGYKKQTIPASSSMRIVMKNK